MGVERSEHQQALTGDSKTLGPAQGGRRSMLDRSRHRSRAENLGRLTWRLSSDSFLKVLRSPLLELLKSLYNKSGLHHCKGKKTKSQTYIYIKKKKTRCTWTIRGLSLLRVGTKLSLVQTGIDKSPLIEPVAEFAGVPRPLQYVEARTTTDSSNLSAILFTFPLERMLEEEGNRK